MSLARQWRGELPGRRLSSAVWVSPFFLLLTGCSRAPLFNILGSYFPAWILCMLISIILTAVVRVLVRRFGLEDYLKPLVLTYPCLTACFAFSSWLVFFS